MKKLFIFLMLCILMSISGFAHGNETFYPYQYDLIHGNYQSGTVNCLNNSNTACLIFSEEGSAPAWDVVFNFSNVTHFETANLKYIHTVEGDHTANFQLFNYNINGWEDLEIISLTDEMTILNHIVEDDRDYILNGQSAIRFTHPDGGNPSHLIDVYSVWLGETPPIVACPSTEIESRNNMMFLLVIAIFLGVALIGHANFIGMMTGIGVIIYSTTIYGCNSNFAILTGMMGMTLIVFFGFRKGDN